MLRSVLHWRCAGRRLVVFQPAVWTGNMLVIVNVLKGTVNKEELAYRSILLLEWPKVFQPLLNVTLQWQISGSYLWCFHCFDHFWSSLLLLQCHLFCKGSNLLYLDVWRQIIEAVSVLNIINIYVLREGDAFFVLPNIKAIAPNKNIFQSFKSRMFLWSYKAWKSICSFGVTCKVRLASFTVLYFSSTTNHWEVLIHVIELQLFLLFARSKDAH